MLFASDRLAAINRSVDLELIQSTSDYQPLGWSTRGLADPLFVLQATQERPHRDPKGDDEDDEHRADDKEDGPNWSSGYGDDEPRRPGCHGPRGS